MKLFIKVLILLIFISSISYFFAPPAQATDLATMRPADHTQDWEVSSQSFAEDGEGENKLWIGEWVNVCYWGGFRFTLPTGGIPDNATVTSAVLQLYSQGIDGWGSGDYLRIFVTDSSDAGTVTTLGARPNVDSGSTDVYPDSLSTGTRWPASDDLSWPSSGQWATSPNFSSLIQHLVDTYDGLASGAHIVVWLVHPSCSSDQDEVAVLDRNAGETNSAKLDISYTEASPTPTPTPPAPGENILDFSISVWVNPTTSITSKALVVKNNEIRLVTNPANYPECQVYVDSSWYTAGSSVALTTGSWQHVACSLDKQGNLRVFVNGAHTGSYRITANNANSSNAWRFGSDAGATYNDFSGKMDDVRIYNTSLSPSQISNLYSWAPGPVGYWKMDENTGTTTTADSSGNQYTGTLTSITDSNWVPGKFGSALNLDGTADFVDVGTGPTVVNTVSFWVKPNTTSEHFLDLNGSAYISASSGSLSATGFSTPSYYINGVLTASPTLTAQTWTHVAVTTATSLNATDLDIGRLEGTDYLSGTIDDVRIYNYVRTPAQIIEDMNADHPAPGSPVGSAVAHWKFDEGYGTTANDDTSNDNDLTLSTASWTNSGKFGKAFTNPNELDPKRLTRTDDPDFDFTATDDFTVSFWFKSAYVTNPDTSNRYIVSKPTDFFGQGEWQIGFTVTNAYPIFRVSNDGFVHDSVTVNTDYYDAQWHHLVAIKTGMTKMEVFIDGQLKGANTNITETGTYVNDQDLYISDANDDWNGDEFIGDTDELQVFRSALTADQVKLLYNQGQSAVMGAVSTTSTGAASYSDTDSYCPPGQGTACVGPVLEWKFDENTSTSAFDTSGNNYTGSFNGTPQWVSGKNGSGLQLDGVDDGSYNQTKIISAYPFTLQAWAKTTTVTDNLPIVAIGDKDSSTIVYGIYTDFDGDCRIYAQNGGSLGATDCTADTNDGKWHHFTAIFNSATDRQMYIDGVYDHYDSFANSVTYNSAVDTVNSGTSVFSGNDDFIGVVDGVRIYNYARTPAQIAWDYNHGDPIAHYKFDEGSGANAYNAALNANGDAAGMNGTITSATYNATGKIGQALDFDGGGDANDYISVTNADTIDQNTGLANGLTVSTWIKPDSDGESDNGRIFTKNTNTWCKTAGESAAKANLVCSLDLGTDATLTATGVLTIGSWNHVVLSWTNDSDDEVTAWVNGKTVATSTDGAGDASGDAADLIIGNNTTSATATFDGLIDDFKIFNYELTAQQIRSEYSGGALRF